jgi:alkylation response protein AidB-like acyl-CoA dehydrogenase
MRTIAQCRAAFDMMCERALSRESHGKVIAEHQSVQNAIADSYAEITMLRLLVLWTAWTVDNSDTRTARTQIATCKFTCAKVLRDVTFRAVHIFGSLGVTHLTPLLDQWTAVPTQSIMDGPDEVHRVTVARHVLRGYEAHEGVWPTSYAPTRFAAAREKYASVLARDPELAAAADAVERDLFARG